MSFRQINTSYEYNSEPKNFVLLINNDMADQIRNDSFVNFNIDNIESVSNYFTALDTFVGDLRNLAFPFASGLKDLSNDDYSYVNDFYSNIYTVEGAIGNVLLDDDFKYGSTVCDGVSSSGYVISEHRSGVEILRIQTSASSGYPSALQSTFFFSKDMNSQGTLLGYRISVTLPVFKETDIVNGKIRSFSANEYMSYITIIYSSSGKTVRFQKYRDRPSSSGLTYFNIFSNEVIPDPPPPPPTDPYDPSHGGPGYSGTGGGPSPSGGTGTTGTGGLHDDSSDAIPTPSLPSDATISSGLFTAYNPSASQLADFANALWNMQQTDINDVLRFLFGGDAFNAIIGLHLLPVQPSYGTIKNIKLGNWDTGVAAPKISSQYVQVPFGSVLLPEYWGNCIDYAPYTKIQLALPYIGIVDVDTDDVLGSTNTLTYNIDVLSGAICATLHCVKFNLSSVIYQWSGACAVSLPFSGASYNSVLSAIAGISAAGMGFAAMAAGPIGAALPSAALAAGAGAFGAGSAASILGTMKGKVQKSGSFGANSGALGIMTPYFILTRPVQSVPASWQADKGYPANISAQLGTLTGYTEVSEINLECGGTEAEKEEIIKLLKSGVIF